MLGRRSVIALLCFLVLGCRAATRRKMPPNPIAPPRGTVIGADKADHDRNAEQADTFTITLMTFIPCNYVLAPSIHPQSYHGIAPPIRLAFAGDDRGFDIDARSYRGSRW